MKSRPLEAARPFPAQLRPLVARFAGDAARAAYTAGPATREALTQAGALGATTGSVVHLPAVPGGAMSADMLGVLTHELTHARQPVGRPRFLLGARSGAMDADERVAHAVGQQTVVASRAGADIGWSEGAGDGAAPVVQRSMGIGALTSASSQAPRDAAAPLVQRSTGIGALTSAGALASVGSRVASGAAVPPPGTVAAGVVDQLPVGAVAGNAVSEARALGGGLSGVAVGGGLGSGLSEGLAGTGLGGGLSGVAAGAGLGGDATARGLLAALAAAEAGGSSLAESVFGQAAAAGQGMTAAGHGALGDLAGAVGAVEHEAGLVSAAGLESATGLGGDATARGLLAALAAAEAGGSSLAESAFGQAAAAGQGMTAAGHGALGDLAGAVGAVEHEAGLVSATGLGSATGLASSAGSAMAAQAAAATGAAARHLPEADIDRIVQAVEQRLLRQLERRGGRYAGVF